MRCVISRLLAVALVAGGVAACDSTDTPTTPTPATPITETFTGSIAPNGAITSPFVTMASGAVSATLTSVEPAVNMGLSLGTWNGTACQAVVANDNAPVSATITGSVTTVSSLCVRVYDVGFVVNPVTYIVTVVHP